MDAAFDTRRRAQLEAFLASGGAEYTNDFYRLHGLFFALASGPVLVPPSQWLPLVLGERELQLDDEDEAEEICDALIALWNDVLASQHSGAPGLPPGCGIREHPLHNFDPTTPLAQWSAGFADGFDYLSDAWRSAIPVALAGDLEHCVQVLRYFSDGQRGSAGVGAREGLAVTLEEMASDVILAIPASLRRYAALGRDYLVVELQRRSGSALAMG